MMRAYSCLDKNVYNSAGYKIVPIRDEDKYLIMQIRNEQIYHLRQDELLTTEAQEQYFANIIFPLFKSKNPAQILFSYLENEICIGYGGLVHINWKDKHAEVSFVLKTEQEKDYFKLHWTTFLSLIEQVAFQELALHKIFTYAFDLRPYLYTALEEAGYNEETRLKEHCLFEGNFIDVVIHSKIDH